MADSLSALRTDEDDSIVSLVARLTLEEKVALITGVDTFSLAELPAIGLRSLTFSDGPIGVRGTDGDIGPSAQLPSPSATAATWDVRLQARIAQLMAAEARRKAVDVVLAPVVNLQRTPVHGRHFECFSEDPLLTARLAASFVGAIQGSGVGACVKHLVGNESETGRTEYVADIDERTLREVYLAPFEAAINAGVWSVMAAYNGLNYAGTAAPSTAHAPLLNDLLKDEWGFDGVVVSDWFATKDGVAAALGGLDLVMPGPGGPWAELCEAVRSGDVPEPTIDDKVVRILRLARRVGALGGTPYAVDSDERGRLVHKKPDAPEVRELIREAAARGTVVLRNEEGLLPLLPGRIASIALIGANALKPFVQGGGSASVIPPHVVSPHDALKRAYPGAQVTLHRGGATEQRAPFIPAERLCTPAGKPGILVEHLDATGIVIGSHVETDPARIWFRVDDLRIDRVRLRVDISLTAGSHEIEIGPVGAHQITVDGQLVSVSKTTVGHEVVLDSSYSQPRTHSARFELNEPRAVRVEAALQVVNAGSFGRFVRVHLGYRPAGATTDEELADAVSAAAAAEVAVVIVGTNPEIESEGWDRKNLQLPARQNELVRRVAAANPRTIVVVNAGAPVILPWLEEIPAVLWWWLPGQEAGDSLAAVLCGEIEPSGRLPWTLPVNEVDVPVPNGLALGGVVRYVEGLDVGYRGWDRLARTPAREFGFGLGYTSWSYEALELSLESGDQIATAVVTISNIGDHTGREVVQLYAEALTQDRPRPVRWLAGFAVVDIDPGQTSTVQVPISRRSLEVWDPDRGDWVLPDGRYCVRVGRSSRDLRLDALLEVREGAAMHRDSSR